MMGKFHAQVFINELHFDEEKKVCLLLEGKTEVSKIDLLGTVVYRNIQDKAFILHLDDGTGILPCIQFQSDRQGISDWDLKNVPEEIQQVYRDSLSTRDNVPDLGDCLHIRGRTSFFKEKPQIIINQMRRVYDINEWWSRVLEISSIRSSIEDKNH